MRRCQQVAAADWLETSELPWWRLVTFGPAGFEAFARLRFIPDPVFAGQEEHTASVPEDHPGDLELTQRALRRLARFTTTPDECYVGIWDSDLGSDPQWPIDGGPLVVVPNRRYGLFAGSLDEITRGDQVFPFVGSRGLGPAFVWPADRRWCFARDVDPHWAGIGAERAAIDALVSAPDIDAVPADPELRQPHYG